MAAKEQKTPKEHLLACGGYSFLLLLFVFLNGCTYVPDWADPVSLYDRVFTGEQASLDPANDIMEPRSLITPPTFPAIADVPREVPALKDGNPDEALIAGLDAAKLTNKLLRREVTAIAPPPEPMPALPQRVGENVAKIADPAENMNPKNPAIPKLARPELPVFRGGPQVNPLLRGAPEPIDPAVALINTPKAGDKPASMAQLPNSEIKFLDQKQPLAENAKLAEEQNKSLNSPTLIPESNLSPKEIAEVLPPNRVEGQDMLAQTFAMMLAASKSTVTTMTPLSSNALNNTAGDQGPNSFVAADPEAFAAIERALGRLPTAALTYQKTPALIHFSHDSSSLSVSALNQIAEIADLYKQVGGRIRVIGHASSRTKDMPVSNHIMANFNISVDRAKSVAEEFIRLGIDPRALIVMGVGDSQPIFTEAMPTGEAENRRVEIFIET